MKNIYLIPVNKTIEIGDICKSKLTEKIVIATLSFINAMKTGFDMSWIPQQFVLVSKEKIETDDWYLYDLRDITGKQDFELMQCRDDEEADRCNSHPMITQVCTKIIAAYPQLDGVPKFGDIFINNWIEKPIYNVDIESIKTDSESFQSNMKTDTPIEIYKIKENFNSPLERDHNKIASSGIGDYLLIINDEVWIRNWDDSKEDNFSKVVYSADFVRINPAIFEKQ